MSCRLRLSACAQSRKRHAPHRQETMTATPLNPSAASGLRRIGRALRNHNFRLFFLGQGVSLIGTWMQQLAMSWLVYKLSDRDAFLLGLVNFAGQIPAFVLVPVAGVLID